VLGRRLDEEVVLERANIRSGSLRRRRCGKIDRRLRCRRVWTLRRGCAFFWRFAILDLRGILCLVRTPEEKPWRPWLYDVLVLDEV